MHRRPPTFRKALLWTVAFLLWLSSVSPAFAGPEQTDMRAGKESRPALSARDQVLMRKVAPEVLDAFAKGDMVTYLVRLREQVDVSAVADSARKRAVMQKESPAGQKVAVRQAVASALRETALRTQAPLVGLLEAEKHRGNVREYESFFVVNALAVTSTKDVLDELALRPEVEKILPNAEVRLIGGPLGVSLEPTEGGAASPASTTQEIEGGRTTAPSAVLPAPHLGEALAEGVEWNVAHVRAPQVWAMGIDGTGVVVANLDTGVDGEHPALARKWRGRTGDPALSWFDATYERRPRPVDTNGHGTHVMGTMVGSEESGENRVGVATGATWIAVRVFVGNSTTTDVLLRGGEWVLAPRDSQGNLHPEMAPDVVNNSWGAGPGMDEFYRDMVRAWRAAGIFPVFANGNSGPGAGTVGPPANYPESFGVGAVNARNEVASFSSRGPSPYGEIKPDVAAPGVNIRSSVPGGGYQGGWSGTSMAAPHVAGVVALLLQANASLTVDELVTVLRETAVPLTDDQYPDVPNNGYGYGLIDAYAAVNSVIAGFGTVEGRVTAEGEDREPPVVEPETLGGVFVGDEVEVRARVTDDVAVTNVELFVRAPGAEEWTSFPMRRVEGDHRSGTYAATIPASSTRPPAVEYRIRAEDYGGHVTETPVYEIPVSTGVKPGYVQDFEHDWYGFRTGGEQNTWARGKPNTGPMGAHSGEYVLASNLTGTYLPNANSWVRMPPIDLTDHEGMALLTFWHWYDLEPRYDFGRVYVVAESTGGEPVLAAEFTGRDRTWRQVVIDLTPYRGQVVTVLWNLVSDYSVQYDGWFVDDVALVGPAEAPPPAPEGLRASANDLGQVTLAWDPVDDVHVKDYVLYRARTDGVWEEVGYSRTTSAFHIPTESGTYSFAVAARTYDGTVGERSQPVEIAVTVPPVLFLDDFNGPDDNGWTHGGRNDIWARGEPRKGPMAALIPPNVWATGLSGNYENNMDASLYAPPIDLRNAEHAGLTFAHWYEIERYWDKARVEISRDGGQNWEELAAYSDREVGKRWSFVRVDLDPYVGHVVQLRFRFTSDSSVTYQGWLLDHVVVYATHVDTDLGPHEEAFFPEEKPSRDVPDSPPPRLSRESSPIAPDPGLKGGEGRTLPMPGAGLVDARTGAIPLAATVTSLETGRSTRSDPVTGAYRLRLPAGEHTLRAEAYGYFPAERRVRVEDGQTVQVDFHLLPRPRGWIEGQVVDERSGAPLSGARILVLEDAQVPPATSDGEGNFRLEVYAGRYTLSVSHPEYHPLRTEVEVAGGETVSVTLRLKPFIGIEDTIAYDGGTADNAWAFYRAGNGFAVRMSPRSTPVQVVGGLFRFWDTSWPVPGGTDFRVAVFDASGPGGAPGKLLLGPLPAQAKRDGTWTEVRFDEPILVEGDFYLAAIQAADYPYTPGLATDETSPNSGRNWLYVDGDWSQAEREKGNFLIRALVRYPVEAPTILEPEDGSFTNREDVLVRGTFAVEGARVRVFNGGDLAGETTIRDGGFSLTVHLREGENVLTAVGVVGDKLTDPSAPVRVIVKLTPPVLALEEPPDGLRTNRDAVGVRGTVRDSYLASLTVNGQGVVVREDGTFAHRVLLDEGENRIVVVATDRAGNEARVERTVYMSQRLPEYEVVAPAEDVTLGEGEELVVRAEGDGGLLMTFRLELPLVAETAEGSVLPMPEISPGVYEGRWRVPAGLQAEGVRVRVEGVDAYGNVAVRYAPGRVNFRAGEPFVVVGGNLRAQAFGPEVRYDEVWYAGPDGVLCVEVRAYDGRGAVAAEGKVYADGRFELALPRGATYTVEVRVPGHLSYRTQVFVDGDRYLEVPLLLAGDVNGDGRIDARDLAEITRHLGKRAPWKSLAEARADLNRDGVVDYRDLAYVLKNLGKRSR
ncbi:S8 family serine peptidase [Brockia lithotrophica]|uniref:Bacillopeptidase F n=1 Tax=Brockia lithotrophica TaxID=933949 RepID=A0A660L9E7_9BACL|nr:S8 family serine peptidase [Brockia lithotrophica]RKQ88553.1 bacillopeptidase F [Brockia lithotrophica]